MHYTSKRLLQYAILMASSLNAMARYSLNNLDYRRAHSRGRENAPPWENKSMYVFYIELVTGKIEMSPYQLQSRELSMLQTSSNLRRTLRSSPSSSHSTACHLTSFVMSISLLGPSSPDCVLSFDTTTRHATWIAGTRTPQRKSSTL